MSFTLNFIKFFHHHMARIYYTILAHSERLLNFHSNFVRKSLNRPIIGIFRANIWSFIIKGQSKMR